MDGCAFKDTQRFGVSVCVCVCVSWFFCCCIVHSVILSKEQSFLVYFIAQTRFREFSGGGGMRSVRDEVCENFTRLNNNN